MFAAGLIKFFALHGSGLCGFRFLLVFMLDAAKFVKTLHEPYREGYCTAYAHVFVTHVKKLKH